MPIFAAGLIQRGISLVGIIAVNPFPGDCGPYYWRKKGGEERGRNGRNSLLHQVMFVPTFVACLLGVAYVPVAVEQLTG